MAAENVASMQIALLSSCGMLLETNVFSWIRTGCDFESHGMTSALEEVTRSWMLCGAQAEESIQACAAAELNRA